MAPIFSARVTRAQTWRSVSRAEALVWSARAHAFDLPENLIGPLDRTVR
jgi:hypothetical protein